MSSPNQLKKYQKFSKQVEGKIKDAENKFHARAVLWIKKLNAEYLGGGV